MKHAHKISPVVNFTEMQSSTLLLCSTGFPPVVNFTPLRSFKTFNFGSPVLFPQGRPKIFALNAYGQKKRHNLPLSATNARRLVARREHISFTPAATRGGGSSVSEFDGNVRKFLQTLLWIAEGVYIVWLFLLPYAPILIVANHAGGSSMGHKFRDNQLSDRAFSQFLLHSAFFELRVVGIHLIEAPVLHPMSEGLFNFVIGWTFMFAPLLCTDKRKDRYKGSLDVLWGFQMFLTNTFLIPYMAIRLNEADEYTSKKTSQLGSIMTRGAPIVGLIGGVACLLSILWALYGRGDGNYGDLPERWEFLLSYLGSERLAYAFIWDICLYIIFQPWLIGDNLQTIQKDKVAVVNLLRFVPVVGLIAYCLCLDADTET